MAYSQNQKFIISFKTFSTKSNSQIFLQKDEWIGAQNTNNTFLLVPLKKKIADEVSTKVHQFLKLSSSVTTSHEGIGHILAFFYLP